MRAYVIKNGDIYAPEHLGKKDILIAGGKIIAIEDEITLKGATVIDAEKEAVLPGFIDAHVHIIGGGGEDGCLSRVPPIRESRVAASGITTVVGLLGTDGYTRTIRDLVAKVKAMKEYGLSCYALTGSYQIPSPTLTGSVGDDIMFIDEIIGVKVAIADHRCSLPSYQELIRLLSEARLASLMSKKAGIVHIHVGSDKRGIEDLFKIARDTPIPIRHLYPTHMAGHMEQAKEWLKLGGHVDITCNKGVIEAVKELYEYGKGTITLSSDSNGSFPIWNEKKEIIGMKAGDISNLKRTFDALISAGLEVEEALPLFTSNVAFANGFNTKGRICEGYDADIAVYDGKDLRFLFANGQAMVWERKEKKGIYEQ